MGKRAKARKARKLCERCGERAKDTATVWTRPHRDPDAPLTPITKPVCASCVRAYRRRRQMGVWVYAVLQICWLSLIHNGLTIIGATGALVAIWALTHLVRALAGLVWSMVRPGIEPPAWMDRRLDERELASEMLKEDLRDELRGQGTEVYSEADMARDGTLRARAA